MYIFFFVLIFIQLFYAMTTCVEIKVLASSLSKQLLFHEFPFYMGCPTTKKKINGMICDFFYICGIFFLFFFFFYWFPFAPLLIHTFPKPFVPVSTFFFRTWLWLVEFFLNHYGWWWQKKRCSFVYTQQRWVWKPGGWDSELKWSGLKTSKHIFSPRLCSKTNKRRGPFSLSFFRFSIFIPLFFTFIFEATHVHSSLKTYLKSILYYSRMKTTIVKFMIHPQPTEQEK